jgi:CRP-like cAMP-binding protein
MGLVVVGSETQYSPYIFCAEQDSVILWIKWPHIDNPYTDKLPVRLYKRYITNCIAIICSITIRISTREEASVQPTARKKILRFFNELAGMQHSVVATTDTTVTFKIHMTQAQLAEFLGMGRPTLLEELRKLEEDGTLYRRKLKKNTYFTLIRNK